MFALYFKDVSREFQGLMVFQECLKGILRVFMGMFKGVLGCFSGNIEGGEVCHRFPIIRAQNGP